jgi:hypothetical protein
MNAWCKSVVCASEAKNSNHELTDRKNNTTYEKLFVNIAYY